MSNHEGMSHRATAGNIDRDEVANDTKRSRVDNHGDRAKAARRYRRRERRTTRQALRNGQEG